MSVRACSKMWFGLLRTKVVLAVACHLGHSKNTDWLIDWSIISLYSVRLWKQVYGPCGVLFWQLRLRALVDNGPQKLTICEHYLGKLPHNRRLPAQQLTRNANNSLVYWTKKLLYGCQNFCSKCPILPVRKVYNPNNVHTEWRKRRHRLTL